MHGAPFLRYLVSELRALASMVATVLSKKIFPLVLVKFAGSCTNVGSIIRERSWSRFCQGGVITEAHNISDFVLSSNLCSLCL